MKYNLLSVSADAKTRKGESQGFLTGVLYLTPAGQGGIRNFCPHATAGCKFSCLNTAGRGAMDSVQIGRMRKSLLFIQQRKLFLEQLQNDLAKLAREAKAKGLKPVARLNGTSDLPWETMINMDATNTAHGIRFYDYTKSYKRMRDCLEKNNWPRHYTLTFSYAENNHADCERVLRGGGNVSVVFGSTLPKRFAVNPGSRLWPVIDGEQNDCRYIDGKRKIIGLKAKGRAKRDKHSGFVIW